MIFKEFRATSYQEKSLTDLLAAETLVRIRSEKANYFSPPITVPFRRTEPSPFPTIGRDHLRNWEDGGPQKNAFSAS